MNTRVSCFAWSLGYERHHRFLVLHRDGLIRNGAAMNFWTTSELVILTRMFATSTTAEIREALPGRSDFAIWSKAKHLKLQRDHYMRTITPEQAAKMHKARTYKTPLRNKVIEILVREAEVNIATLHRETGAPRASCFRVLQKLIAENKAHITRYDKRHAIYRVGSGVSAQKPAPPPSITPIPRPKLGAWGLVWTTSPAMPAERNSL